MALSAEQITKQTDLDLALCFADLSELDHVVELLNDLATAQRDPVMRREAGTGLLPTLRKRIQEQEHHHRASAEASHPGAFDRSTIAAEYAAALFLIIELENHTWRLPAKLEELELALHRVMIVGNLSEDELHKMLAERATAIEQATSLRPLADHGKKFSGRKPGSGGPIRKAIARLLKKKPALKNPDLWNEIKGCPPRGWSVFENSLGKYIEGPKPDQSMKYANFCNVCSEERKKIREKEDI